MATSGAQLVDGGNRVADATLAAAQYCAVFQSTTARTVSLAVTASQAVAGVLQNTPSAGQAAIIVQRGITQAAIGATGVTAGDQLKIETLTGKFLTTTAGSGQVGVALETCAAGGICTIDFGATA